MTAATLIAKKRDGEELSTSELTWLMENYLSGEVLEYQMSAFLMAVYFKGMTASECGDWVKLMRSSGRDLPRLDNSFRIDKHSTGGIGDKTSIILVPWVLAALEQLKIHYNIMIPMISGRGLGFTGGTLDKLASIPGFRTNFNSEESASLLRSIRCVFMGQTDDLVPADKKLYALRDVTATVESLPLIVTSILSKKFAENLDALVLDVKWGSGALYQTKDKATELARALVAAGKSGGIHVVAFLTAMNEPLGFSVGNSLEIKECADFLKNQNHHVGLFQVTLALAEKMVQLVTQNKVSCGAITTSLNQVLKSGSAYSKWLEIVQAHGGDWKKFEKQCDDDDMLPWTTLKAETSGYLYCVDAKQIGLLLCDMGGGRTKITDGILNHVGFFFEKQIGDRVEAGQTIARVRMSNTNKINQNELKNLFVISERQPYAEPWVSEVMDSQIGGQ